SVAISVSIEKGLPAMIGMKMGRVKMSRVKLRVAFLLLSGLVAACAAAQTGGAASGKASLAFARAEQLRRGINASEWVARVDNRRGHRADQVDGLRPRAVERESAADVYGARAQQDSGGVSRVSGCGGEDDPRPRAGGCDRPASGERLQSSAGEGRRLCRAVRRFLAGAGRALLDVGCGPRVSGNSE